VKNRASLKVSKTKNVEVVHGRGSDMVPNKSVPEIVAYIRDKLVREGPQHETVIADDLEREFNLEPPRKFDGKLQGNSSKIARAMEKMVEGGEVMVGGDGTWVLVRG